MRIVYLTTGTGSFYCGSCMRDAGLARALRALGHDALLAPLYLPMVLDEAVAAEPVRMGGINVFLAQSLRFALPRIVQDWLDSPWLLRWAARRAGMTQAHTLGEMTVSMLRGDDGAQKREVEKLGGWLAAIERPDAIVLSNALLLGLVRPLRRALGCPVLCTLQGEAPFLDALPEPHRSQAWRLAAERAREVSAFLPVSQYTAELMRARLALEPERVHVVHNGIDPAPFGPPVERTGPPTVGFLARLFRDKGLVTLVEAFLLLRARAEFSGLRLLAAGTTQPSDRALLRELSARLDAAGCAGDYAFHENVDFERKLELLRAMTVFSVPATYGESFGLYLLEAWATGLPVVQPEHGAFPELLRASGGGILVAPDDPRALADGLARLLADPVRARALGEAGRASLLERFSAERMARDTERVCRMAAPHAPAIAVSR